MRVAQPKSGELLDLLGPSLNRGENLLSEFEIRRIIREARKLPERYQGLSIEGLALISSGDVEPGCNLCERSLTLAPNDSVSFCNYTRALRNQGLHVKQYEVLEQAVNSHNPSILMEIATVSASWVDFDLLQRVMPMLNAMEVPRSKDIEKCNDSLEYLREHESHVVDLKRIGRLMMQIADKHRLRLVGSNAFNVLSELNTLFVEVKTDSPELLSAVNNELADEIIAAGLENSDCVGCFQAGEL